MNGVSDTSLRAEVRLASKTQAGAQHRVEGKGNEDAVFVSAEHPLFEAVLMVADGMGGHPRPSEASQAAVAAAQSTLFSRKVPADPARALAAAIEAGQRAVRALHVSPTGRPPGTTLSVAVVSGGQLQVAHVGDGSVFLMREGQVQPIAGGEHRRAGNRPEQYLGQEAPLEVELRRYALEEGDRLLLCTDGLTRYFHEAGPEALERILGRPGVSIDSVAGQLISHSRAGQYDDDTTVALLEVAGFHERHAASAPMPASLSAEPIPPHPQQRGVHQGVWAAALVAMAAVGAAGGFFAGRMTAPPPSTSKAPTPTLDARAPVDEEKIAQLPPGNLILVDALGKRVFALSTRKGQAGKEPLSLTALAVGAGGRLSEAGRFRLDPLRGELTDPNGKVFPVDLDTSRGVLQILRGVTLKVNSRPRGAEIWLDGKFLGKAPQQIKVAVGAHQIRAVGRGWEQERTVDLGSATVHSVLLERPSGSEGTVNP